MQTPTTSRYEIDLKHCIWDHDEREWAANDECAAFFALRDLQPFDTIEICSTPRKEDRNGRVLITKIAHGHYEAHGTFSTEWGDLDGIVDELELDLNDVQELDDVIVYNANGAPGVSRDFHFIESSFALILLAVDHVESMLILQDLEEWQRFMNRCDHLPHNTWSTSHD